MREYTITSLVGLFGIGLVVLVKCLWPHIAELPEFIIAIAFSVLGFNMGRHYSPYDRSTEG